MWGNGLMNDAWLGQTVKPSETEQTGHDIQPVGCEHACFQPGWDLIVFSFGIRGHSIGE
jgi:hypothetical protein